MAKHKETRDPLEGCPPELRPINVAAPPREAGETPLRAGLRLADDKRAFVAGAMGAVSPRDYEVGEKHDRQFPSDDRATNATPEGNEQGAQAHGDHVPEVPTARPVSLGESGADRDDSGVQVLQTRVVKEVAAPPTSPSAREWLPTQPPQGELEKALAPFWEEDGSLKVVGWQVEKSPLLYDVMCRATGLPILKREPAPVSLPVDGTRRLTDDELRAEIKVANEQASRQFFAGLCVEKSPVDGTETRDTPWRIQETLETSGMTSVHGLSPLDQVYVVDRNGVRKLETTRMLAARIVAAVNRECLTCKLVNAVIIDPLRAELATLRETGVRAAGDEVDRLTAALTQARTERDSVRDEFATVRELLAQTERERDEARDVALELHNTLRMAATSHSPAKSGGCNCDVFYKNQTHQNHHTKCPIRVIASWPRKETKDGGK